MDIWFKRNNGVLVQEWRQTYVANCGLCFTLIDIEQALQTIIADDKRLTICVHHTKGEVTKKYPTA